MRSSLEDGNRGIRGINPMASTELVNRLLFVPKRPS